MPKYLVRRRNSVTVANDVEIGSIGDDVIVVLEDATISSVNSSVAALSGGASFTGTFEEVLSYTTISIVVNTDSIAVSNGLQVQFSTNGTDIDRTESFTATTGGYFAVLPRESRYVRVKVNAGVGAQSFLRLQTIYSISDTGTNMISVSGAVTVTSGSVTVNNAAGASAVNIQDGGNSITVDGSVTANAGTNLNTSALALESGNLKTIADSLNTIDDWDESDRAKVNLIVGQAGVQGNTGTVTATTQRVVLATNVGLPAGSSTIGSIASITTSVVPGTGATNLGKAEDAAAASGDTGVVLLAQRHDAYTSTVSANEDYSTLHVDSLGRLKAVDVHVTDGNQVSALYDPISGRTGTVERVEPTGGESGLYVYAIPNYSAPLPVDAAVSSITPGTGATNLGKAEDAAHTTGATGVMALAVRNDADTALAGTTGDYIPIGTDAVGRVQVNSIGKLAHDAADTAANSPLKVGGAAVTNNDALTSVASGDMSNFSTDRKSRHIVDSDRWQVASATNATTTDAALIAAPGAGLKLQVYGLFVCLTCPVQTLNVIKDEGVRFRFASGTYHFNVVKTVHHVHTILNAPDSVAFPLEPTMIDLQHGHWDGGDNEALNFSLMGLSGAALGTAYVTAYYRVMPT